MKVALKAGATLDVMTSREMRHELARHRKRQGELAEANRPIPKTVEGAITLDAAGFGVIDLGEPAAGRTWNVRRVSVVFQDVLAAAAAGIVNLARSDSESPYTFVQRFPGTVIPATLTYSADQFTLQQVERLLVVVSAAGSPSVGAFATAQVVDGPRSTVYELDLDEPVIEQGFLSNVG